MWCQFFYFSEIGSKSLITVVQKRKVQTIKSTGWNHCSQRFTAFSFNTFNLFMNIYRHICDYPEQCATLFPYILYISGMMYAHCVWIGPFVWKMVWIQACLKILVALNCGLNTAARISDKEVAFTLVWVCFCSIVNGRTAALWMDECDSFKGGQTELFGLGRIWFAVYVFPFFWFLLFTLEILQDL